jgi:hypothetical protein
MVRKRRIYPSWGTLYYTCVLFENKSDMYQFYIEELHGSEDPTFDAIFCPSRVVSFKNGKRRMKPSLGHVLFCRECFTPPIQAHEITHAALDYLRDQTREVLDLSAYGRVEERLAYLVSDLLGQLTFSKTHSTIRA